MTADNAKWDHLVRRLRVCGEVGRIVGVLTDVKTRLVLVSGIFRTFMSELRKRLISVPISLQLPSFPAKYHIALEIDV